MTCLGGLHLPYCLPVKSQFLPGMHLAGDKVDLQWGHAHFCRKAITIVDIFVDCVWIHQVNFDWN
jgi:hypothetical protein